MKPSKSRISISCAADCGAGQRHGARRGLSLGACDLTPAGRREFSADHLVCAEAQGIWETFLMNLAVLDRVHPTLPR